MEIVVTVYVQYMYTVYVSICCIEYTCAPVTHPNASAVVLDLQELQSAFFHRHLDIGGFGIQTATFRRTHQRAHVRGDKHVYGTTWDSCPPPAAPNRYTTLLHFTTGCWCDCATVKNRRGTNILAQSNFCHNAEYLGTLRRDTMSNEAQ